MGTTKIKRGSRVWKEVISMMKMRMPIPRIIKRLKSQYDIEYTEPGLYKIRKKYVPTADLLPWAYQIETILDDADVHIDEMVELAKLIATQKARVIRAIEAEAVLNGMPMPGTKYEIKLLAELLQAYWNMQNPDKAIAGNTTNYAVMIKHVKEIMNVEPSRIEG
jgi:hypothetical protein